MIDKTARETKAIKDSTTGDSALADAFKTLGAVEGHNELDEVSDAEQEAAAQLAQLRPEVRAAVAEIMLGELVSVTTDDLPRRERAANVMTEQKTMKGQL